jgi:hypothetical protein
MMDQEIRQTILDDEHLKLLSIGYYVSAGITAAFSLFGLLYSIIGMFILIASHSSSSLGRPGEPPPAFIGAMFMVFGLAMFAFTILAAILKFLAASRIKRRKSRVFCMLVAGISCIEIPYGTLLGVFTFMVLGRNSVRVLFESAKNSPLKQTETIG